MPNTSELRSSVPQRLLRLQQNRNAVGLFLALLLGALGALPLIVLTPPFQVPDENWHFYRAYEISNLQLLSDVQNGVSGAVLPSSLPQLVHESVYSADQVHFPATPTPLSHTLQHLSLPLNPAARQFVTFPGSAFYSPLPYIPQALGIAIGRLFGLGPLGLLYAGRIFNCLAALALLACAAWVAPFAKEVFLLAGLLPMSLYLYASVSADAALISCALVFTALALAAATRGSWKKWELAVAVACAAVFCSVKPVYFPLLLAAAIPHLLRREKTAAVLRAHAILIGIPLAITVAWMALTRSSMTTPLGGGHPSGQLRLIFHHPMVLGHALAHTLGGLQILVYYCQAVGVLGWLLIPLSPGFIYLLPIAAIVVLATLGIPMPVEFPRSRRLWLLALALASAFLVLLALYVLATPVGQGNIVGVQGRYFIPILAMAGLVVIRKAPAYASPWRSLVILAAILLLQIAATDYTILTAFKVF